MTRKVQAGKAATLDARLKAMFQALEARPVPDSIRSLTEQLAEDVRPSARRRARC